MFMDFDGFCMVLMDFGGFCMKFDDFFDGKFLKTLDSKIIAGAPSHDHKR